MEVASKPLLCVLGKDHKADEEPGPTYKGHSRQRPSQTLGCSTVSAKSNLTPGCLTWIPLGLPEQGVVILQLE